MSRLKKGGTVAALAVATIGGFEGLRQTAYPDPATRGKPWTICYGHTGADVHPGLRLALDECKALLLKDAEKAAVRIETCIPSLKDAPAGRYVAVLSLAFNIGEAGVCKSSVARLMNAGQAVAACNYFLKYNRAAGVVFPGLTRRREQERRLCLLES